MRIYVNFSFDSLTKRRDFVGTLMDHTHTVQIAEPKVGRSPRFAFRSRFVAQKQKAQQRGRKRRLATGSKRKFHDHDALVFMTDADELREF